MWAYLFRVLVGIDQLANTLIGGQPDETLSARAWRGQMNGKILARLFRPMIDWLFRPFEEDHCRKSWESERRRSQLPDDYAQQVS